MKEEIKKDPRPHCPVCNSLGEYLYLQLKDNLFGGRDLWNVKECKNKECKTLWLDPTPNQEEIYKLYTNYTTHIDGEYIENKSRLKKILNRARLYHLSKKFNYKYFPVYWWDKIFGWIIVFLFPIWADEQSANIFYLPYKQDGILLDVGCGAGGAMQMMIKKGWKVKGIDFDEKAIKNAKQKGLDVNTGDLFSQKFDDESFDAIMMNHVIEHLPNPEETLKECRRILKKDGVLVSITPNAGGRGHKIYKENWRGLEVPTHLQVFTVNSLGKLAKNAGFQQVKNFSSLQGQLYILDSSKEMQRGGTFDVKPVNNILEKIIKKVRWFIYGWLHLFTQNKDEVAVIVCEK